VPAILQSEESTSSNEQEQGRAAVKRWMSRITSAKKKWEPDFARMKRCMEFVTGLQWDNQKSLDKEDRYIVYITLRLMQQKVATLYAKNPTAIAIRRPRMDFQVWDESMETIVEAMGQAQQWLATGQPLPMELAALFADFQHGQQQRELIDKFCKTFEIVYGYQIDATKPEFKEQLKQAVRRVVITSVAYARPIFCQDEQEYQQPSSIDVRSGVQDRVARIRAIVQDMDSGDVDDTSAEYQTLRSLVLSLGAGQVMQDEFQLPERLEFDFPPATSIIVDERCRNLVEFIDARWIAQEYILPVAEVNAIFGAQIEVGGEGGAKEYNSAGRTDIVDVNREANPYQDPFTKKLIALYEVFDKTTKTRFFIVDGWKDYVSAPEPAIPATSGFWQHFALVFNNVEVEEGTDASIYPPSDVWTLISPQKEWNRTREDLRDHRRANGPRYLYREGTVSREDLEAIANAAPNTCVGLKSIPPDMPLEKAFVVMPVVPIEPTLYDTTPLEQDMMIGANMQQANVGPAQPNVTATVGTIAEQSRLNVSASNIDDLDGFLSRLAQAGGEMLLQGMSVEVVKRIAGVGAVWPDSHESRIDFLNEVYMSVQAASSGRPNKAVDIANFGQVAPLLQAAGANPAAIVEEGVRRLDDQLDVTKFFPLTPPVPSQSQGMPPGDTGPSEAPPPEQENRTVPAAPIPLAAQNVG
jgi:hypothetical protein